MMFGLMNIAFNFDQLAKALQLAYSGEAPPETQEKAPVQTDNDKHALQARDLRRFMDACEHCMLALTYAKIDCRWLGADPGRACAIADQMPNAYGGR